MQSNVFGKNFRITTFGESRSKALGVVIDGVQPNLDFDLEFIKSELSKRKPGASSFSTQRKEIDEPIVLSGVFNGKTLGTPICIVFFNNEQTDKNYEELKNVFRPGHADFTWFHKYGIRDYRGGGRSSGRETVARVAAGALAKYYLKKRGITLNSYSVQIGDIKAIKKDLEFAKSNELKFCDPDLFNKIKVNLNKIKVSGDSAGGIVEVTITGVPVGLGDPVFEKLNANLGKAVLSIGGVKGVEFGKGFESTFMKGSEFNDSVLLYDSSNNNGGISGGISNGKNIVLRCAIRPVSSILKSQETLDIQGNKREISISGNHDVILIPRIIPVIEAMCALVIADALETQQNIEKKEPDLEELRYLIDQTDLEILQLLKKRMEISKKIGNFKKERNMEITDCEREEELFYILEKQAKKIGLSSDFIKKVYELVVKESKQQQTR